MNNVHDDFTTHRCDRPKGFSVRKYEDGWNANYGWGIWHDGFDYDFWEVTLELGALDINFCPWCGERLE